MKTATEFGLARGLIRKGIFPIEIVMALRKTKARTFKGDYIALNSPNFEVFEKKGFACARCGIEGQYFAKERPAKQNRGKYFFSLCAIDDMGREARMTRDHIVPSSKGGKDELSNYQTMCERCNVKKKDSEKTPKLNLREKSVSPQTDPAELEAQWSKLGERRRMAAWMEGYAHIIAEKTANPALGKEIRSQIAGWEAMKAQAKKAVEEKTRELSEATKGMLHQEVAKTAQALIPNPAIRKLAVRLCLRSDENWHDMLWREAAYALAKCE